jgi:hypothetical protein
MYYFCVSPYSDEVSIRHQDGRMIPSDPMNVDYLQYVAWLFDGNTPEEWNPEQMSEEQ